MEPGIAKEGGTACMLPFDKLQTRDSAHQKELSCVARHTCRVLNGRMGNHDLQTRQTAYGFTYIANGGSI